jgi:hypothetical protein
MAQKVVATSDLIKWCDDQVAQGKELKLAWEGGGDSGWVYFKINDKQVSDSAATPEIEELIDRMYDQLDYGSWAGEFSANGEAAYYANKKAFIGTDYYGEDETYNYECSIKITVPKSLWFDAVEYNIEQEEPIIDVAFVLRNGFLTEKHTEVALQIKESLNEQVDEAIADYQKDPNATEYRNVWQNERIERNEFKEEGDNLVAVINELAIGTYSSDEKDIYLELITQEDEY